ncbi:MAG: TRAP transporter substrate-binding protein DctP [Oscillospiraceae bacterium]
MKKVVCLILALVMVFSLAACGSNNEPSASTGSTTTTTPADSANTNTPDTSNEPAASNSGWDINNIGEHKFILAHGLAETSMTAIQYHEFCEAVKELSQGKIVIEERIAGSLVTDTETLDAIMDGTIDFCHSMGSYVSGTITDLSPLTIAGYYGGDDWRSFIDETHDLIESIYADYGIKYLGGLYQGNSVIVCNDRQIKSPGDVKGLTFRASGTWVSKTVEAWGGAATTIGLADLADAFSKKTVSGVATGYNIIVPFKIYEVAKYVTHTTMSEGFAALLMNGDRWAELNADEQALLEEAAEIFETRSQEIGNQFMDEYVATIENSGVNETYTLSADEQQQFIELAMGLYDEMAPSLGEKGLQLIDVLKSVNGIA